MNTGTGKTEQLNLNDYKNQLINKFKQLDSSFNTNDYSIEFRDIHNHVINDLTPTVVSKNTPIFVDVISKSNINNTKEKLDDVDKVQAQLDKDPLVITNNKTTAKSYSKIADPQNPYMDIGVSIGIGAWTKENPVDVMRIIGKTYPIIHTGISAKLSSNEEQQLLNLKKITYKDSDGNLKTDYLTLNQFYPSGSVQSLKDDLDKLSKLGDNPQAADVEKIEDSLSQYGIISSSTPYQVDPDNPSNLSQIQAGSLQPHVFLTPEYDSNDNIIQDKFSGRVYVWKDITTSNTNILYQSLDPNYRGTIKPFYAYTGVGSGGGTVGFLTLPVRSRNSATASVKFIDDSTEPQSLDSYNENAKGFTGDNIVFKTPVKDQINTLTGLGYELVSDNFDKADGTIPQYQIDNKKNVFEVHLTHQTQDTSDSDTVNETIHYVYSDGSKAQDDYVATPISFKRTGTKDLVTGETKWNAWTPENGTFDKVVSPSITGYTPDQTQIDAITVIHSDQDIDKTVTYNANDQLAKISYIDDTIHKTLLTDNGEGKFGEKISFTTYSDPQTEIDNLTNHGYELVSNDFDGQTYQADNAKNIFEVHFTHQTEPANDSKTIHETIHYVYSNGDKAHDDYIATPITFEHTGTKDQVTGDIKWDSWTPVDGTFDKVVSPSIAGYTPDQTQIDTIRVTPDDDDITKTVTYNASDQVAKISYIDDTAHTTLLTDNGQGKFGEKISFTKYPNPQTEIDALTGKGYKLVSNDFSGQTYQADDTKNIFEVHFTHQIQDTSDSDTINETIHYVFSGGSKAHDDYVATPINFKRTGTKDLVTGDVKWNAWTPENGAFKKVESPNITGYTPDQAEVEAITVKPEDKDIVKTVTYTANDQLAKISYIDDTAHTTLITDNGQGKFDEKISFTKYPNPQTEINALTSKGYQLVSNNFKDQSYQADNAKNVFEVHLKHQTQTASDSDTVKEIIHYVYSNGDKAHDDYAATPINFKRTGTKDLVTGDTKWDAWTPGNGTFDKVESPDIAGYTPDQTEIKAVTVQAGDKDIIKTVTYGTNDQLAQISYIDDTAHTTLLTDNGQGKFGEKISFAKYPDPQTEINTLTGQGYELVSNDFKGQSYQADNNKNVFEVHLKHQTQAASDSKTVHETIHYVFSNGDKASDDYVATPITFNHTGTKDLVTKETQWNAWTPENGAFKKVESPNITGYTPDRAQINVIAITPNDSDITKTVTYIANDQLAKILYIDDTAHQTLLTDNGQGKFGEKISFAKYPDPQTEINTLTSQGYELVSNNFKGQTYQADNSKNVFEVHLKHQTQAAKDGRTVSETIHYVFSNGDKASDDYVATPISFKRTGTKDLVTGNTKWDAWTPESGTFDKVESPKITGYTPDQTEIKEIGVKPDDKDIVKKVTYNANDQTAKITYIDDTAHKDLATDNGQGKFGETISFKKYPNPQTEINTLTNQGYKLVSNNFKGQTYQADNAKNIFEVHFTHKIQNTSDSDTVNETIHYVYSDDSKAHDDYVAKPISFTRTGKKDLVTGDTKWNAWTPENGTFDKVESPSITGYTPDQTEIKEIGVKPEDKDIVKTVTYSANAQTAKITYIDDTAHQNLATDNGQGKFGETISFTKYPNPQTEIDTLTNQGYKLVSNNFNGQTYQVDNAKNVFEVHLVHQYKPIKPGKPETPNDPSNKYKGLDLVKDVTRDIKYIVEGPVQAPAAKKEVKTFVAKGYEDLVTHHLCTVKGDDNNGGGTIVDQNGKLTWTLEGSNADDAEFAEINNPSISGYKVISTSTTNPNASVDNTSVKAWNVNHESGNATITVVYGAQQKADLIFHDQVLNTDLKTDSTIGYPETQISFNNGKQDLDSYISGPSPKYKFVNITDSNGNVLTNNADQVFDHFAKFDKNYITTQKYIINLTHRTAEVTPKNYPEKQDETVTRIINYVTPNGYQAPASHTDVAKFKATGIVDLVTGKLVNLNDNGSIKDENGKLTWTVISVNGQKATGATATTKFDSVDNPAIKGLYVDCVDPNDQTDKNKTKVIEENNIQYNTPDQIITVVYAKDGEAYRNLESKITKATVHYVIDGDDTNKPQAPEDNVQTGFKFTNPGERYDTTTGKAIGHGEWNATSYEYATVVPLPVVDGYHAVGKDGKSISYVPGSALTVTLDKPEVTVDVHYIKNETETRNKTSMNTSATVHYIIDGEATDKPQAPKDNVQNGFKFEYSGDTYDKTTGQLINQGKWNASSYAYKSVDPLPTVAGYHAIDENGKSITSVDGKALTVTQSNPNVVVNVHYIKNGEKVQNKTSIATSATVHYIIDGNDTNKPQAPKNNVQDGFKFEYSGDIYDKTTGQLINKGKWNASSHAYNSVVPLPAIAGYHAVDSNSKNINYVPSSSLTVTRDNPEVTVDVHYIKNGEKVQNKTSIDTSATVHYIIEGEAADKPVAPKDNVQDDFKFEYSGDTYDKTTGQLINKGKWNETSHAYNAVTPLPSIAGYHAVDESGKSIISVDSKALTVTQSNPDVVVNVYYIKNGEAYRNPESKGTKAIVHYVIDGNDANKPTAPKDNVQDDFKFTNPGEIYDTTTGKAIGHGEWNATSHEYETVVPLPVVAGYHAVDSNGKSISYVPGSDLTVTLDKPEVTVDVHYVKNETETRNKTSINTSATVHYIVEGEADDKPQAPKDNVQNGFKFEYSGDTYDKVTKELIDKGNWNETSHAYNSVTPLPVVAGYHAVDETGKSITSVDKSILTVTRDNPNVLVNVYYIKNGEAYRNPERKTTKATVHYVIDGDDANKPTAPKDNVQDSFKFTNPGERYDTTTGKAIGHGEWNATSHEYETVVPLPVVNGYHAIDKDGHSISYVPGSLLTVTLDKPEVKVEVHYIKNGTETRDKTSIDTSATVHYIIEGEATDKPAAPKDNIQNSFKFEYSGDTYDKTTGQLISKGNWNASSHAYNAVTPLPVVAGYHAVDENGKSITSVDSKALTVTQSNPNVVVNVYYIKNDEAYRNPESKDTKAIVHYVIDGDDTDKPAAPKDNVQDGFKFTNPGERYDTITGKVTSHGEWNTTSHEYDTVVPLPAVAGYHAVDSNGKNISYVPGSVLMVTLDKPEVKVDVHYIKNGTETRNKTSMDTSATVHYIVDGEAIDKPQAPKDNVQTGFKFEYSGDIYDKVTKELISKGKWNETSHAYNAVTPLPTIAGYHAIDENGQTITSVDSKALTVTQDNPNVVVNIHYIKNGEKVQNKTSIATSATVHYIIDGNETNKPAAPADNVQNGFKFEYSGDLYDQVTKRLISKGKWNASSHAYDSIVPLPTVAGYHAVDENGQSITSVDSKDLTVTQSNPDIVINVYYIKNVEAYRNPESKTTKATVHYVIDGNDTNKPQAPADNVQDGFKFTNPGERYDTTTGKVLGHGKWNATSHEYETVVPLPTVAGYHAVDKDGHSIDYVPGNALKVTLDKPEVTVNVHYVKDDTSVTGTVTYIDKTIGKNLRVDDLKGDVGEKITYTTQTIVDGYVNKGYKLVFNDFTDGHETFAKNGNKFIVILEHTYQPVNPTNPGEPGQPINPKDPNGPKYPQGSDQVTQIYTRTINYTGAGDKTPKSVEQTVKFEGNGTLDKVTGKWILSDGSETDDINKGMTWSADQTLSAVPTKIIDGYHIVSISADSKDGINVDAKTISHQNGKSTVLVTYAPNGKIVPVGPDGKPIPDAPTPQYPTDPENPKNVKPNEDIPTVPGYEPKNPGQKVTPTDPGKDTPVPYVKNPDVVPATGTVTYVDKTTGKDLKVDNLKGNVGDKITYTTQPTIDDYLNKGYKLVSNTFKDGDETFAKDGNKFVVTLEHDTIDVTPDKPGKPGEPINPNDPDGPKYPDNTGKNDLEVTGHQTIHYTGAGDNTPKDITEDTTFTRHFVIDKVTGEIVNKDTSWTPDSHTFDTHKTPVVDGYVADVKEAGGFKSTPSDPDKTYTVTYKKIGKIVPVDPNGNKIPNAPTPEYKNDPDDPTKVVPDEPVPGIDGYTPSVNKVTPADPTKDTPVVYTKNTPVVPTSPDSPQPGTPTPTPQPSKPETPEKPEEPAKPDQPATPDNPEPDEPDEPDVPEPTPKKHHNKKNNNTPQPTSHKPANWSSNNVPYGEYGNITLYDQGNDNNTRPIAGALPNGEHIDSNGNIIGPNGQVIGYIDKNGKAHYTLPQTDDNQKADEAAYILGGAAVAIGMIGLAGVKKRKED